MLTDLMKRMTLQQCGCCDAPLSIEDVQSLHVTLLCLVCGHRQYVITVPDWWA